MMPVRIHRRRRAATVLLAALLPFAGARAQDQTDEVWRQLAAGLRLSGADRPEVDRCAASFARHRRQLTRMLAGSAPFLSLIVHEIARRDLPQELALLPAIESHYDPAAVSPQGAAGLWQFLPDTARRYGLRRSDWYEGRRDPLAATHAALDDLHALHDRFEDWPLAIAAYNAGEGRVASLVRASGTRDFWQIPWPAETRNHVCRLLGLARVVRDPRRYGVTLPAISPVVAAQSVALPGQLDLHVAAAWTGLPVALLRRYNPALKLDATDPDGPDRLLVPAAQAERLRLRLAQSQHAEWVRYQPHRIAAGDSLWTLARRFGSTVTELKRINGLRNSRLRAGRMMLVPQDRVRIATSATATAGTR